jgi:hypothetical protein
VSQINSHTLGTMRRFHRPTRICATARHALTTQHMAGGAKVRVVCATTCELRLCPFVCPNPCASEPAFHDGAARRSAASAYLYRIAASFISGRCATMSSTNAFSIDSSGRKPRPHEVFPSPLNRRASRLLRHGLFLAKIVVIDLLMTGSSRRREGQLHRRSTSAWCRGSTPR